MMTSGRAIASISLKSLIFRASRSGAASWMKSARDAIVARSVVKVSSPRFELGSWINFSMDGQATSIAARSFASAAGATS